MGRTYLRYELKDTIGIVSSPSSNVIYDASGQKAISAGLESVLVWNLRTATLAESLKDFDHAVTRVKAESEVTVLSLSPNGEHVAAGYSDGSIKIWHLATRSCILTLNGHKGTVSFLQYHSSGTLLASGSADTDIILWDVVGEAGLFRLRGHTDMITGIKFVSDRRFLISSSKDTLLKVWDLETQHCLQTVVGHRSEVWSFDINPESTRLVAGSAARSLRFYAISFRSDTKEEITTDRPKLEDNSTDGSQELALEYIGEIEREGKERVGQLQYSPQGEWLACLAEKTIEFFAIHKGKEAKKRKKKRKAKHRKKQSGETEGIELLSTMPPVHPSDEVAPVGILKTSYKAKSFDFSRASSKQLLVGLSNNTIEVWSIELSGVSFKNITSLDMPGHRSDVRALALSDDDTLLVSTSADLVKVWNIRSLQCVRTLSSGYGLCAAFVPGNTHVAIGTKEGMLELFSLSSGVCVCSVKAHDAAVWSLAITPDMQGIASASADHDIKFWDFELVVDDPLKKTKKLGISPSQTLKMSEDVLSICYSKDGKFIAASLLDSTVKVFFVDTMKFFLSLYGHKLPVLSVAISSDNTLLVSGSADKNIKIWGLDFGDCHRSLLAHQDSVTQVQFVPNTHYFFSASKDKTIKYWDADKFEHIMTLSAHYGEIWSLAVANQGTFVVSGSQDRSIRIWQQTDEPLFLEEERENEMEALLEEALDAPLERGIADKAETSSAGKRTVGTIKAGEKLAEALELVEQEKANIIEYNLALAEAEELVPETEKEQARNEGKPLLPPPTPNVLLMGKSPSDYLLATFKSIKPTELEEALLVLPFASVLTLLSYLDEWIQNGQVVELSCRCVFFLLKVHHHQIVSNASALSVLRSLKQNARKEIRKQKDVLGFNKAAMSYIVSQLQQNNNAEFFDFTEKLKEVKQKQRKRKRTGGQVPKVNIIH